MKYLIPNGAPIFYRLRLRLGNWLMVVGERLVSKPFEAHLSFDYTVCCAQAHGRQEKAKR